MKSIATFILFAAVALPALSQMRCGTELITEGDSALSVLEACGEPSYGDVDPFGDDEWTYNFGPNEFMIRLTIQEGTVRRIEELDYGFIPD